MGNSESDSGEMETNHNHKHVRRRRCRPRCCRAHFDSNSTDEAAGNNRHNSHEFGVVERHNDRDDTTNFDIRNSTSDAENNVDVTGTSVGVWESENAFGDETVDGNSSPITPKYPYYVTYESRIQTYIDMDPCAPGEPENYAKAGFFRRDAGHDLTCYFCGGSFSYWDIRGDIWEEHERLLGRCYFHESFGTAELNSPGVRLAIEMGFEVNIVKNVLDNELIRSGSWYENSDLFVNACIEYQNDEQRSSENIETTSPETNLTNGATAPNHSSLNPSNSNVEASVRREILRCRICMDEDIGVVFMPCGHQISCPNCASNLKNCPVCREEICTTIRTFLP